MTTSTSNSRSFRIGRSVCALICVVVATCSGCSIGNGGRTESEVSSSPHMQIHIRRQTVQVIVSIREQRLALFDGAVEVATFPISTAKNGASEAANTGGTPRGMHEIAAKVGTAAPPGTVFENLIPTGEIVDPNSPGRLAIVTRILRLRGIEQKNQNTFQRQIYIHGTPAEGLLGKPASAGGIRMGSQDIVTIFDRVAVGTRVDVFEESIAEAKVLLQAAESRLMELESAASRGGSDDVRRLCFGYVYGMDGLPINNQSALKWCELGTRLGDAISTLLLADIYEKGRGVEVTLQEARRLYEMAARLGNTHATYRLSHFYAKGLGGETNPQIAAALLTKAARGGHADALREMGSVGESRTKHD